MKLICLILCFGVVLSLPIENAHPINYNALPQAAETDGLAELESPPANVSRVPSTLNLPSNATSIRNEITDTFSCQDRIYGYYADVDNDCQIFHICLPVTYADGKEKMFRWSFVCPDETIFSQEHFTCIRPADWAGNCSDTENYIHLNTQFGQPSSETEEKIDAAPETGAAIISDAAPSDSNEQKFTSSATNEQPLEKSFTDDDDTHQQALAQSETLSYGLFNVRDPLILRTSSNAIGQDNQVVLNNEVESETTDAVALDDGVATTESSSDHSTDIWNMYTESLYDGSTIDDIVEVNAVGLQSIEEGTTQRLENADK